MEGAGEATRYGTVHEVKYHPPVPYFPTKVRVLQYRLVPGTDATKKKKKKKFPMIVLLYVLVLPLLSHSSVRIFYLGFTSTYCTFT